QLDVIACQHRAITYAHGHHFWARWQHMQRVQAAQGRRDLRAFEHFGDGQVEGRANADRQGLGKHVALPRFYYGVVQLLGAIEVGGDVEPSYHEGQVGTEPVFVDLEF